jgi:hypothetical protein
MSFVVRGPLLDSRLNLSQHKALQTLKLRASSLPTNRNDVGLPNLLSAITSYHLNLVIVYGESDFSAQCALRLPGHVGCVEEPKTKSGYRC